MCVLILELGARSQGSWGGTLVWVQMADHTFPLSEEQGPHKKSLKDGLAPLLD